MLTRWGSHSRSLMIHLQRKVAVVVSWEDNEDDGKSVRCPYCCSHRTSTPAASLVPLPVLSDHCVVCTGTQTCAPPPSTAMWMLAADVSVDGILMALVVLALVWFDCEWSPRVSFSTSLELHQNRCPSLHAVLWHSLPQYLALHFRHFANSRGQVSHWLHTTTSEGGRLVSHLTRSRQKEKTNFISPTKENDKAHQRSKPNNHQKNTHWSHTVESIILHAFHIITSAQC